MVSDERVRELAHEAEKGYDVEVPRRRARGRPGRGAQPMQVVVVRLTAEELDTLDAAAARHGLTRAEAIRAALARFHA
ncbi:ribbon-helix-helix protein, CopG family [Cellulomonas palmilytica]|nr:ribbon-helix-helix protein, CopG family [Cellulomonas palmilytica]